MAVRWRREWERLRAALLFYTVLPLTVPPEQPLSFDGIALYAPLIGIFLGIGLASLDLGLTFLGLSEGLRAALVVAMGLVLTGGLHWDGLMDTADGLAVPDRERRLAVMADSRSGAYGVMMALVVFALKVGAIADLEPQGRWLALIHGAAWGRWGQLCAVRLYPYLRAEGKGRTLGVGIANFWVWALAGQGLAVGGAGSLIGFGTSWAVGYGLFRRLGGHTGDTYGATVELSEMFIFLGWAIARRLENLAHVWFPG
jgi:adenosylcobinamide-GDP ribazoletransferase